MSQVYCRTSNQIPNNVSLNSSPLHFGITPQTFLKHGDSPSGLRRAKTRRRRHPKRGQFRLRPEHHPAVQGVGHHLGERGPQSAQLGRTALVPCQLGRHARPHRGGAPGHGPLQGEVAPQAQVGAELRGRQERPGDAAAPRPGGADGHVRRHGTSAGDGARLRADFQRPASQGVLDDPVVQGERGESETVRDAR